MGDFFSQDSYHKDFALSVCICVLLQVEKRLDLVKQVTHSTHKKLTACLQGQQGADTEKRSVKSPSVSAGVHHALSHARGCFAELAYGISRSSITATLLLGFRKNYR